MFSNNMYLKHICFSNIFQLINNNLLISYLSFHIYKCFEFKITFLILYAIMHFISYLCEISRSTLLADTFEKRREKLMKNVIDNNLTL